MDNPNPVPYAELTRTTADFYREAAKEHLRRNWKFDRLFTFTKDNLFRMDRRLADINWSRISIW